MAKPARGNSKKLPALIGVIHLPALPGAPGAQGEDPAYSLQKAGYQAVQEALALTQAGFEGIVLENFGDTPFFKTSVPAETVASMAVIAAAVREATKLPLGINVLRNDAKSALAIASVTGCQFIRVNVLTGLTATDQGLIEGNAAELLREKARLGSDVAILADAQVKHAKSLSSDDIARDVEELSHRARADGVIVSGSTTGRPVEMSELQKASAAARKQGVPLYIGSGATRENVAELRKYADGIIVSSDLRKGGTPGAPLDSKRMKDFVRAFKAQKTSTGAKVRKKS